MWRVRFLMAGADGEDRLNCDDQDDGTRLFHSLQRDDTFGVLVWLRLEEFNGEKWERRLEA